MSNAQGDGLPGQVDGDGAQRVPHAESQAGVSSEGLSPRNLREMVQSRPQDLRPKTITMRRRDWVVPDDECMQWLMEKVDVRFVEGSSDDEDDGED